MKLAKVWSTEGVFLEEKPVLNQSPSLLWRRNIFFVSIQNKLCFIPQRHKNFKKTHSFIDPLGLPITQTHMSGKAYSLMIKAKQLGIKPPGLFYRKKKYKVD